MVNKVQHKQNIKIQLCDLGSPQQTTLTDSYGLPCYISLNTAIKLVNLLSKKRPQGNICLCPRNFFGFWLTELYYGGLNGTNNISATLQISTDFKQLHDTNTGIACIPSWNSDDCLQHLATGKCTDQYIRETIGRTVFPELYSTNKQKIK